MPRSGMRSINESAPINHRTEAVAPFVAHRVDHQVELLRPELDDRAMGKVLGVGEDAPLMLGLVVEDVDGLAQHRIRLDRQVLLQLSQGGDRGAGELPDALKLQV